MQFLYVMTRLGGSVPAGTILTVMLLMESAMSAFRKRKTRCFRLNAVDVVVYAHATTRI